MEADKMNTLDDFIRSWDNVVSPEKFIILRAPGTFIAMVRVDDFTVKIDSEGKEVLEFYSEGRWKARLYLELIQGIEGGVEE